MYKLYVHCTMLYVHMPENNFILKNIYLGIYLLLHKIKISQKKARVVYNQSRVLYKYNKARVSHFGNPLGSLLFFYYNYIIRR